MSPDIEAARLSGALPGADAQLASTVPSRMIALSRIRAMLAYILFQSPGIPRTLRLRDLISIEQLKRLRGGDFRPRTKFTVYISESMRDVSGVESAEE